MSFVHPYGPRDQMEKSRILVETCKQSRDMEETTKKKPVNSQETEIAHGLD